MIENYYQACTRLRPTTTTVNGRPTKTYTETRINGYLGLQNTNLVVEGGKHTAIVIWDFLCDDFNLQIDDLIEWQGDTYRVISEPDNIANKNHHIECKIRKIKNVTDSR